MGTGILRVLVWKVGGFDERFCDGVEFDDDAFRLRVERAGVEFICRDDAVVVHQEHEVLRRTMLRAEYMRLRERNRQLFEEMVRA